MTITKRPVTANAAAIDKFIGRAPDAGKGELPESVKRRKETISLGLDPLLLVRIDALAARLGMSRAAAIAMAIAKLTESQCRLD